MNLGTGCADIALLGISVPSLIRSAAERSYSARAALCVRAEKIAPHHYRGFFFAQKNRPQLAGRKLGPKLQLLKVPHIGTILIWVRNPPIRLNCVLEAKTGLY
jgi:hypothetical protein